MRKKVIKLTSKGLISNKRNAGKATYPVMSKSNLHDYFADKMAAFSTIIGYIFERATQSHSRQAHGPNAFAALYNKLTNMRSGFLNKYHQLNFHAREGMLPETNKIKALYEHIYRFEENVVSEIVRRRDLIGNKRDLLEI